MNESHKLYDKILRDLPKDGNFGSANGIDKVDLRYLKSLGYMDYMETADGNILYTMLTDEGMVFISQGGFAEQNRIIQEEEEDKRLQRENWETTTKAANDAIKMAKTSKYIAIGSLIVSIIATALSILLK